MTSSSRLLEGKVAIVTGSNRGIGCSIVEEFAKNGAIVYANARREDSLNEMSVELSQKYNTKVIPVYFDVTDESLLKQAFLRINREQKRLDILVNNAGIMKDALIGMVSSTLMRNIFDTNVFATINMLQYAVKLMSRQKSGSIINISSIVGVNGNPGQIVYSASKGAVISITKTAAKELAPLGIRVNAIAPGMIDTDMFRSIGEPHIQERISKIGMGRLGTSREVADTAVYLGSDLSNYVTGQIIGVDGGALV